MFDEIIGNQDIKVKLESSLKNKTLSNTMLFSGPQGIGKNLFALHLAAQLMHPDDPNGLLKIKSNNHPDLHIYEPEGKTAHHTIGSIRDLIEQIFLAPFESKAKVFIINDADRMAPFSSNALLKTLEEPTFDSYIILITSKPEYILPTIQSRCFKMRFSKIEDEKIYRYLIEKQNKNESDAKIITKLSDGCIGKALTLVSDPTYFKKKEFLISILSKEKIHNFYDLSDNLVKLEELFQDKENDENSSLFKDIDMLIDNVTLWFRDLCLLKENGDEKHLHFPKELSSLAQNRYESIKSLDSILRAIEEMKLALFRNIKLKHALENFFININFII